MSKKSINTEKLQAKNLRNDIVDAAVSFLGYGFDAASRMATEALVSALAAQGFDEEGVYESLVDTYNFGNYKMENDISELCLPSLIHLWIECTQAAASDSRDEIIARRILSVTKAPKAARATKAAAPFQALDSDWWWANGVTPVKKAKRVQNETQVQPFSQKYETSPRIIIKGMVNKGGFTKAEMRAEVLRMIPDVKGTYLNTMLTRLTSQTNPLFKCAATENNGVICW